MIDLFKIDFIKISLIDILDIIIVAYFIYLLYKTIKGTIAAQIFIGLIIILLLSFVAKALNFLATSFILKLVTDIWVIAFVILFQPELRKLLISITNSKFFRLFIKTENLQITDEIISAVNELSKKMHGALILIGRNTGLRGVVETGIQLNSAVSKQLLLSIFFPKSPLHDGAVVIKNNSIIAARCTLPLSSKNMVDGFSLGMRHKAGLGISELSDAFVIIVSEETGGVSISENGNLQKNISQKNLEERLNKALFPKTSRYWKNTLKIVKNEDKYID